MSPTKVSGRLEDGRRASSAPDRERLVVRRDSNPSCRMSPSSGRLSVLEAGAAVQPYAKVVQPDRCREEAPSGVGLRVGRLRLHHQPLAAALRRLGGDPSGLALTIPAASAAVYASSTPILATAPCTRLRLRASAARPGESSVRAGWRPRQTDDVPASSILRAWSGDCRALDTPPCRRSSTSIPPRFVRKGLRSTVRPRLGARRSRAREAEAFSRRRQQHPAAHVAVSVPGGRSAKLEKTHFDFVDWLALAGCGASARPPPTLARPTCTSAFPAGTACSPILARGCGRGIETCAQFTGRRLGGAGARRAPPTRYLLGGELGARATQQMA